jgi:hypothetical protein
MAIDEAAYKVLNYALTEAINQVKIILKGEKNK